MELADPDWRAGVPQVQLSVLAYENLEGITAAITPPNDEEALFLPHDRLSAPARQNIGGMVLAQFGVHFSLHERHESRARQRGWETLDSIITRGIHEVRRVLSADNRMFYNAPSIRIKGHKHLMVDDTLLLPALEATKHELADATPAGALDSLAVQRYVSKVFEKFGSSEQSFGAAGGFVAAYQGPNPGEHAFVIGCYRKPSLSRAPEPFLTTYGVFGPLDGLKDNRRLAAHYGGGLPDYDHTAKRLTASGIHNDAHYWLRDNTLADLCNTLGGPGTRWGMYQLISNLTAEGM